MSNLKQQALSGIIWTFAQQFSVQIINFGVQIILARLLMPKDFGLIAMLAVFIAIGETLMNSGMTSSIIRTKNPDQLDYSTVFMTNMIISVGVYLITYFTAPLVSAFYEMDLLKHILRVYALSFVIRAFIAVHIAKLTKEMNFKAIMRLQIPSTLVGAITGATLAYTGFGVWSLVWLNLTQSLVFSLQCWFLLPWKPTFVFNKRRFRYHFNFGYKLTLSSLLDTVYRNIYPIAIGKTFTPTRVGYFNQAETMRLFPVMQLSSVLDKVTYPLFAKIKGDEGLRRAYKSTMKLSFFITIPVMLVLILTAKEVFFILFGEKWLPAVPYFQILATASIVRPLSMYNLNIIKIKGRSDLILKLEVIKKSIGFIAVFAALPFGMTVLVISYTVTSYISTFINMFFSGRLIQYSFFSQLKDCAPLYLIGGVCFITVFVSKQIITDHIQQSFWILIILGVAYCLLYAGMVFFFEKRTVKLLQGIMKSN